MYWVISSMNAALCKYIWLSASDRFVSRDNQKRAFICTTEYPRYFKSNGNEFM